MQAFKLHDLMVARLVRDRGGAKHLWRSRIGDIRLYSVKTHPHCNWAINPTGTYAEVDAIENLADELRLLYPLVR